MYPLETFPEHLVSLHPEDWKKLFRHLPELDETDNFGGWQQERHRLTGVIYMPHVYETKLVTDILQELYELQLIISFDWGAWTEGSRRLAEEPFFVDDLDAVTICKMITGIIRSDRFNEGSLLVAFQNGRMPALLRALEAIVCPVEELAV